MLVAAQTLGYEGALPRLKSLCISNDSDVRLRAANALQDGGDHNCIDVVLAQLTSSAAGIIESGLLSLSHITSFPGPPPEQLAPLLIGVIRNDPDAYNAKLATQVVEHLGDDNTKAEAKRLNSEREAKLK